MKIFEHSSQETSADTNSQKMIDALFLRFSQIWSASVFIEKYGVGDALDATKGIWMRSDVAGLAADELSRGVTRCINELKWPPTVAEFLSLARVEKRNFPGWQSQIVFKRPALPAPTRDSKKYGREQINELRRLLS